MCTMEETTFLIIGGGIAGVTCAESLAFLSPDENVVLISSSPLIKAVTNLLPLTKMLQQFDVEERDAETITTENPNVKVIHDSVIALNSTLHLVYTKLGTVIKYKKLCICSGAVPKLIPSMCPYIIGIRDTESVKDFQKKVQNASRIVVVGNGGIATEVVHELTRVDIIWVIKDTHISATFIDPGAGEFFQHRLLKSDTNVEEPTAVKRMKFTVKDSEQTSQLGAALGPDWHSKFDLKGTLQSDIKVKIEYKCEVKNILTSEEAKERLKHDLSWPVFVELTNGNIYGCDLIVSATGVSPNSKFEIRDSRDFEYASDGGIKVNDKMETNVEDIYAAGDVCSTSWEQAPHWFQMRLWTQARQMGMYSAKVMAASLKNEEVLQDFCFELFTHVTKFFGYNVVLLGLYNGQTLNNDYELLLRMTRNVEYIKLVMKNGRLQGAVLIGETDLEEMCENLILDQLDLTEFGEDLLNPDIDIEDYFD